MASRSIKLDGTEISVLKGLGIGGSEIDGETLIGRCNDLDVNELIDTLKSLMDLGYVDGDSEVFYSKDDMAKLNFRVNSGYAKDLRNALNPSGERKTSKRVRRE